MEDDPADVLMARRELRGLDVQELFLAMSLREALQLLHQESVDVIIADLNLPDAWGLEAVSRLSAAAPSAALIALTGASDLRLSVEALRAGAQDYLLKEGGHRTLQESVLYALERKAAQVQASVGQVLAFPQPERGREVTRSSGEVWGTWLDVAGEEGRLPALLRSRSQPLFVRVRESWLCGESAVQVLRRDVSLEGVVFVLEGALSRAPRSLARLQAIREAGGRVILEDSGALMGAPWVLEHIDGAVLGAELCALAERAVPLLLLRALVQLAEEADWLLVGEGSGEGAARLFAAGCPLVVAPAR